MVVLAAHGLGLGPSLIIVTSFSVFCFLLPACLSVCLQVSSLAVPQGRHYRLVWLAFDHVHGAGNTIYYILGYILVYIYLGIQYWLPFFALPFSLNYDHGPTVYQDGLGTNIRGILKTCLRVFRSSSWCCQPIRRWRSCSHHPARAT
jgi:hypothetical protein